MIFNIISQLSRYSKGILIIYQAFLISQIDFIPLHEHINNKVIMIDIKRQLKLHGSNISDVASKMGMGQPALSQQISNKSIKLTKVEEIANALGISVSDFLAEDGSKVTIICPHCGKPITFKIEDSEGSEK